MNGNFLCFVVLLSAPNLSYASAVKQLEAGCEETSSRRLEVHYNRLEGGIICGDPYDLTSVTQSHEPQVKYAGASKGARYTLIMADPDAPSPMSPTKRYWLHWLVTNIEGDDLIRGDILGPKKPSLTVKEYEGPSPPRGSGYHRYYFYLFEQDGLLDINAPPQRGGFDVAKFVRDHNGLRPIPVALNMFYTERDE